MGERKRQRAVDMVIEETNRSNAIEVQCRVWEYNFMQLLIEGRIVAEVMV